MTAPDALLVAAFDSQLKWAVRMRTALEDRGFSTRLVKPTDIRNSISDDQMADHDGLDVEELTWTDLLASALDVAVVVVVMQGAFVARFCNDVQDLAATTRRRPPVLVSGWVGVVLKDATSGYLDRCAVDVLAVNSRSDLRHFAEVADSLGIPGDNLVLSGLPLLPGGLGPQREGPVTTVMYADQPTVPSTQGDRSYVYRRLMDYAQAHPDRSVVLKPRHRPGEDTIHQMKFHPEVLLQGVQVPPNFRIDHTPIADRLGNLDLMLTVSSTAALEALAAGVRTAFVADLGVRESLGNHIFLGSGLLRTFDEIAKDDVGTPRAGWLDEYFFPVEGGSPAAHLAGRVCRVLEGADPRPSEKVAATAFAASQRELFRYRDCMREEGTSTRSRRLAGLRRRARLLGRAIEPAPSWRPGRRRRS